MVRSTLAACDDLTCDDFLGGKLRIWQPRIGYRAGVDPVILAASVPAKPGDTILELGCGVGVASLCIAARVPDVQITGVEIQVDYAALAKRNARENKKAFDVFTADLRELPVDYVKIDGSFVTGIHKNRHDYAMARSINDLAHFLGQETIAESVENDEIVTKLEEIGVDYLQGWGIGKPKLLTDIAEDLCSIEK